MADLGWLPPPPLPIDAGIPAALLSAAVIASGALAGVAATRRHWPIAIVAALSAVLLWTSHGGEVSAHLLATLLVIGPLALALLVSRRFGRLGTFASIVMGAGVSFSGPLLAVSTWDAISVGLAAICGALIGSRLPPGRKGWSSLAVLSASSLVACAVGEALVRVGPDTAGVPDVRAMSLSLEAARPDETCVLLYPQRPEFAEIAADRIALRTKGEGAKTVLFVGESFTDAITGTMADPYPAQVGELLGVRTINMGIGGVGLDVMFLALDRALKRAKPDLIVLAPGVATPSRLSNVRMCCPSGPLLVYGEGPLHERCPDGHGTPTFAGRLRSEPLPYLVRVAGSWSAIARRLLELHMRWRWSTPLESVSPPTREPSEWNDQVYAAFIRRARADGVPVLLWTMRLPTRNSTRDERPSPNNALRYERLGFLMADDEAPLRAAFLDAGPAVTHLPAPDPHWSRAGHTLVARWLAPQVERLLAAPPVSGSPTAVTRP